MDATRLPATEDPRPEVLRRLLLALVTALVVARPLVAGEDPGLLDRLSNAWGLSLSLLWFVAAVGWAVWRAWSGQTTWRGSAVEAGLLAVVALVWISAAAAAHYKHPALLMASEWLVLLIAFCLVRQLARTPGDDRGLLAAVLATGVSISAYAVYQYTIEFPEIRRAYGTDLDALVDAMAAKNVVASPEALQRRLFENNVFATYSHPNSFAGYLALLLPVAIGWTFRAKGKRPKAKGEGFSFFLFPSAFFLAVGGALLVGLALWLTHSRGAILGCLLAGIAVLAAYGRRFLAAHKASALAALAVLAVCAFFLSRTGWVASGMAKFWESSEKRNDYWIATWNMIRHHPWLGVGAGNFGRLYPRYMLPRAFEKIQDPHNFVLEVWATGGLFALLALLIALGMFFRRTWSVVRSPWSGAAGELPPATDDKPWTRWEFYLGGMVGLVLGFVLRAMDQSPDEILLEGVLSACRSLIWFTAFAVFYSIPWPGASRAVALTAGVAALFLNLLVSGGIALPSVAQPLWVMAALALNAVNHSAPGSQRSAGWLPRMLPLPLLGGIGLAYFLLLFIPAVSCGDALAQARRYYGVWHADVVPRWRAIMEEDKRYVGRVFASCTVGPLHPLPMLSQQPAEPAKLLHTKSQITIAASHYLQASILDPLERAAQADPGNALPWLELAEWYGEQWKLSPAAEPVIRRAIDCAKRAELLDPDNKGPYLSEHSLHMLIAQRFRQREKEEYGHAAAAMRAAVERDPTNARLRYELAETFFLADLPVEGRHHATIARELDKQATKPERELTASQREQIRIWLTPP